MTKTADYEWEFDFFPLDIAPEELEPFADIVEVWKNKIQGATLPKWNDFDITDFKGWHANLGLCDVVPGQDDARYRIWGSGLTALFGHDATGLLLSEADLDYTDYDRLQFRKFIAKKSIMRSAGHVDWQDRFYKHVTFLRLPLSEDGQSLDRYIVLFMEQNVSMGQDI